MAYEFKFPDVGEGIHEGKLVEWLVRQGDPIAVDQPFARVETDKAIVELPSPSKGSVQELRFNPGDTIHVGDVMIVFSDREGSPAGKPLKKADKPDEPKSKAVQAPEPPPPVEKKTGRVLATPHTRAYARQLGVDLAQVTPTGKGGRVTDEDVDRARKIKSDASETPVAAQTAAVPAVPAVPILKQDLQPAVPGEDEPGERVPASHLRKLIARNMRLSKQVSAHVTHVDEADVTRFYELYRRIKAQAAGEDVRFTILSMFIKAAVAVLKTHPVLNASYDEASETILLKKFYHIGIAADTPEGLMVPVIRHADRKDMIRIAREVDDLAQRARVRKLALEELRGATFTITNVGAIGGVFATPIIPQPQLAILGLHAIKDRPAVFEGQIAIRKMMFLSLSFDHRIIDGIEAARFMTELVSLVENPDLLMMRMH